MDEPTILADEIAQRKAEIDARLVLINYLLSLNHDLTIATREPPKYEIFGPLSRGTLNYTLGSIKSFERDRAQEVEDRLKIETAVAGVAEKVESENDIGAAVCKAVKDAFPYNTGKPGPYNNSHRWLAKLLGVKTYGKIYNADGWDATVDVIKPEELTRGLQPIIDVIGDENKRKEAFETLWAERDHANVEEFQQIASQTKHGDTLPKIKTALQAALNAIEKYEKGPVEEEVSSAIDPKAIKASRRGDKKRGIA